MSNWRRVDEIITYYGKGVTPKYVDNSSIIVLNQKCVRNNKIDYSFAQFIDYSKVYNEDKILKIGDILINSTGQGTAGRVAMVEYIPDGFRLIVDSHILVLRTNNFFESKCLNYSLFSIESKLQTFMDGSTGQGEFDKIRLFNVNVGYPKDDVIQQKIAKVLSDLDAKIELNNKINAELEAMAKTLYDYWFVQFDFPDKNGKPYKSSGGKMVWNEILKREIPVGWGVEELDDCIDLILDHRGKTPTKLGGDWTTDENGIIALSAKIVKNGKLINLEQANKVSQELYDKWMPVKLIDGDILMTSEAPAGEFYFIQGKTDYCMSQRLFAIRANQTKLFPTYLYYELSKGHGYSQILGSLSGSTVFGIRQDVLRTIKVVVPDFDIQDNFNQIVLPQLKKIKKIDEENQQLASLRDWLLPMLMNGQVTVGNITINDIEKDEVLAMVAEPVKEIVSKRKKETKVVSIKANPVEIYKRTLLAAEIVYQLHNEATLGHLKLQKLLYLCQEVNNMSLPMNFLKQAMGPYDNRLMRSLDKQFEEKRWFKFEKTEFLKYKPLGAVGSHQNDYLKYFEGDKPKIDYLIATFRKYRSHDIEAVATLYACWKEAIGNKELVNLELILKKFYAWSEEKEKFKSEELKNHLNWMKSNGICPKV